MNALVTGAASGIGAALAEALALQGALVIATDRDEAAVEQVAMRITASGGRCEARPLDVTCADDVVACVGEAWETHGGVDLLINNAGIAIGGEASDLSIGDWRRVIDVNLVGVVNGVQATYPRMVRRGNGQICNVASVAGLAPYPLNLPYTTSKHGVVGMSLALRAEAAASGVRVSVACPGAIDTPIWRRSEIRGGWNRDRIPEAIRPRTTAQCCAEAILTGLRNDRAVITVTAEARLMWWLQRLSPTLSVRVHRTLADYAKRKLRA